MQGLYIQEGATEISRETKLDRRPLTADRCKKQLIQHFSAVNSRRSCKPGKYTPLDIIGNK
jgi:hypothetical protein